MRFALALPVLLLVHAAACTTAGTIDPSSTGVELRLAGDATGLHLAGTPIDPSFAATYSNPRGLDAMAVRVMADGSLRATCRAGDADAPCSDPPFLTQIERSASERRIRVYDVTGALVADVGVSAQSCEGYDDVGGCDEDGDGDVEGGDDCDGGHPPDQGGGDGGPAGDPDPSGDPDPGADPDPSCDGYDDVGSCTDCPALRVIVQTRFCEVVNQALAAHGIDHVSPCEFDDEWDFSSAPPDVEPGCNDIVDDPAEDLEDDIEDSACPELESDLVNWQMNARGDLWKAGVCGSSPLLLDLAGDGIELGSSSDGVPFDLLGTGELVRAAWPVDDDAFLVRDLDGDGAIGGAAELFGNATGGRFHRHGFAALDELDQDRDGLVDQRDPAFAELRLWSDRDHDGRSAPGELETLAARGVRALELAHRTVRGARDRHGNDVPLVGQFLRADGSRAALVDAYLAFDRATAEDDLVPVCRGDRAAR